MSGALGLVTFSTSGRDASQAWLEALQTLNATAAQSTLWLVQSYPLAAIFLALALVYFGTTVKANGVSVIEGVLSAAPKLLSLVFAAICEILEGLSQIFGKLREAVGSLYDSTYRKSMAMDTPIALFFSVIAAGAIFVNLQLIFRPLKEWFGSDILLTPVGAISYALLAALFIILIELAVGAMTAHAVESARASKGDSWSAYLSSPFILICILFLAVLGTFEAYLAFRREGLIEDAARTRDALRNLDGVQGPSSDRSPLDMSTLPTVAQAVIGFILPFILALISTYVERLVVIGFYAASAGAGLTFAAFALVFRVLARFSEFLLSIVQAFVAALAAFMKFLISPFVFIAKLFRRSHSERDA